MSLARRRLFNLVLGLVVLALGELATTFFYRTWLGDYESLRLRLAGDPLPAFQRCVPAPYLLYVPIPGYRSGGAVDHNEQGYRGPAVPMDRRPGVVRVLALGGSTTYGWSVPRAEQAWPALLGGLLAGMKPQDVEGVEIINGGLPYGTSAEMLTHYLFKFHYFRPDLVILEAGGNDADATTRPFYEPDYSHWRRAPEATRPLPRHTRWLMNSRLASLLFICVAYGSAPHPMAALVAPADVPPPTRWYPRLEHPSRAQGDIPLPELAMAHNLEALVSELRRDGARVLLVPFRPNPVSTYPPKLLDAMAANEEVLRALAARDGLPLAPFPASVISPGNWTDNAHLNAAGEAEKARHLAPYAARALWGG